jgi:flagellar FliL protein
MQKIIALVIVIAGLGGGLALGVALRPSGGAGPEEAAEVPAEGDGAGNAAGAPSGDAADAHYPAVQSFRDRFVADQADDHDGEVSADHDYVKVGRQLIVPLVEGGETRALMLFELALDVPQAMSDRAYSAGPRLRDAFMRELFEMSYTGAFSQTYTDERVIEELRGKLRAAARRLLGNQVADVLILDVVRQEL